MTAQNTVQLDTVQLKGIRADIQTPVTAKTVTSEEIKLIYSG